MTRVTVISDVHGKYDEYLKIVQDPNCNFSIQLGDFGFEYDCLSKVDSDRHKIFSGNHDNIPLLKRQPHDLGDFGVWKDIFYIRGAYSIDKHFRMPYISWWPEEELEKKQCIECIGLYQTTKPDIVISHDCPQSLIYPMFGATYDSSHTRRFLNILLGIHMPKLWVFGHHHKSVRYTFISTTFICLDELETLEIEV